MTVQQNRKKSMTSSDGEIYEINRRRKNSKNNLTRPSLFQTLKTLVTWIIPSHIVLGARFLYFFAYRFWVWHYWCFSTICCNFRLIGCTENLLLEGINNFTSDYWERSRQKDGKIIELLLYFFLHLSNGLPVVTCGVKLFHSMTRLWEIQRIFLRGLTTF
jgi:hypothetical protein